eukprot:3998231-Pyramimonas_sp.AAC.1
MVTMAMPVVVGVFVAGTVTCTLRTGASATLMTRGAGPTRWSSSLAWKSKGGPPRPPSCRRCPPIT